MSNPRDYAPEDHELGGIGPYVGVGNGDPMRVPRANRGSQARVGVPVEIIKHLTCRKGDEESPGHEQNMQHHQPRITRRQRFVGTHPHSRVFRPIRWRGGWIQLEIFLLVPFGLDLSVVRVAMIMLGRNCEGEREDKEEAA